MRTFYMIFLWFVAFVLFSSAMLAVTEHTERIQLDSGVKTVHYITFHPIDGYALKPVTADNKIGRTAELATMATEHEAVAAINGTFFNAYDPEDLHPMGAIMIDRELQHVRGGPVAMGITTNGALTFQSNLYIPITVNIEKLDGSTRTWSSSFINHLPASNDERNIFTPAFRSSVIQLPGYEFVIVRQGVITSIVQDEATIPADGYVISFDPNRWKRGDTFDVGDSVTYGGKLPDSLHRAAHMISVGPKLVSEGMADVNFERDRMTDPNMTQYAAQRSFIGQKADGTIVMGTAANVTMYDLADLLVAIGIHEAMNLDGGASSGLYLNGKYITRPGRNLSNALVVVKQPLVPSIWLNEYEVLFDDAAPFIQHGTTLVPVRGVFEKLGATLEWDGATESVIAKRFDAEIQLTVGKKEALVNGEVKELLVAPVNVNGRVHIPLRFVSEALGAEVDWDANTWTISIKSDILTADYHY